MWFHTSCPPKGSIMVENTMLVCSRMCSCAMWSWCITVPGLWWSGVSILWFDWDPMSFQSARCSESYWCAWSFSLPRCLLDMLSFNMQADCSVLSSTYVQRGSILQLVVGNLEVASLLGNEGGRLAMARRTDSLMMLSVSPQQTDSQWVDCECPSKFWNGCMERWHNIVPFNPAAQIEWGYPC